MFSFAKLIYVDLLNRFELELGGSRQNRILKIKLQMHIIFTTGTEVERPVDSGYWYQGTVRVAHSHSQPVPGVDLDVRKSLRSLLRVPQINRWLSPGRRSKKRTGARSQRRRQTTHLLPTMYFQLEN